MGVEGGDEVGRTFLQVFDFGRIYIRRCGGGLPRVFSMPAQGRGRGREFGGDQFDAAAHMDRHRLAAGAGHGQRDHRHVLLECGDMQDLRPVYVDGLVVSVLEADHRGVSPSRVVKEIWTDGLMESEWTGGGSITAS